MDSEPSSGVDAQGGSIVANARGSLRDALGAVRNLAQLLHSLRVAPKALTSVIPDVLDACTPMRDAVQTLLGALVQRPEVEPARLALGAFYGPRIAELESALREAMARPLNAKSRLALEDVVAKSSFELDAARELLQLLEEAVRERRVRLDPRELVREVFAAPPSARSEGRALVSAMLSHGSCQEVELNPKVTMVLVALGVELVGSRPGRETPQLTITSDGHDNCIIRIHRLPNATGELLVLASRGIVEPTIACLEAATALTRGRLEWNAAGADFSLSYPIDGAVRAG